MGREINSMLTRDAFQTSKCRYHMGSWIQKSGAPGRAADTSLQVVWMIFKAMDQESSHRNVMNRIHLRTELRYSDIRLEEENPAKENNRVREGEIKRICIKKEDISLHFLVQIALLPSNHFSTFPFSSNLLCSFFTHLTSLSVYNPALYFMEKIELLRTELHDLPINKYVSCIYSAFPSVKTSELSLLYCKMDPSLDVLDQISSFQRQALALSIILLLLVSSLLA